MIKRIYTLLRKLLSVSLKQKITFLLYKSGIKPRVNKSQKSHLSKAIVVFSADFEMAWAFRFSKKVKDPVKMGLQERNNFPEILGLFNQHHIPVSWATVGHLFLDGCQNLGKPHPELKRPEYFENRNWIFDKGDWYDADPCSDVNTDPAWYAPDLIKSILDSPVKHEIACHTFSHIDFSDKNCPPELAESEIQKCKELAEKEGVKLKSMVFPGGTEGNMETLKKYGFRAYRKPMKYDVDLPYKDEFGLLAIPSSLGLDGKPDIYSSDQYLQMAKSFIRAAVKYKLVCHFWFHPSMNPWYLKNVLPEILSEVAKLRDNDQIEILTMSEVAEKFQK
jgi:peptidoglycan/xylan/chitin deacetylase (PgdA/CDA1 family)